MSAPRSALRVASLAAALVVATGGAPALAQSEGPVAAYAFSEASGAAAADSSNSGTGTALLSGAAHTAGRFGNGLQLDGVDDLLQLPLAEHLAFSNAFTVEAWIAPSAFGVERSVWWTPSARLTVRAEGTVVPVAMLTNGQVGFLSEPTLKSGVWAHVAVTYDGSMLRLFIDGVDAGSRPATGTLLPAPLEPGILGGTPGFAGKMDEVRFYRRALSLEEIKLDRATPLDPTLPLDITARSPLPNTPGVTQTSMSVTFSRAVDARTITASTLALVDSTSLVVPATVAYDAARRTATIAPTAALAPLASYTVRVLGGSLGVHDAQGAPLANDVSWTFRTAASSAAPSAFYNFSEAAGTIAADGSGNGNDATLVNGAAWVAGRIGGGLRLDGVDDGVQLPNSQTLSFSSAFTVEAWISPTAFDRERTMWWTPSANMTLRPDGWLVPVAVLTDGQIGFISNWTLPANVWSHVAMSYDGSMLRLYINGMDAGSRPATGTLMPTTPPQVGVLGGSAGFAGAIDEVRLFRRALSAAEIAADSVAPPEPVEPFAVTGITPADLSTYVAGTRISATFNRAADAASVTSATVQLRDGANQLVAATVAYESATKTVTLTPAGPLAPGATYTVRVAGGANGVKGEGGGTLPADVQWSFRTAAAAPSPTTPHINSVDIVSSWLGQAMLVNGSNFGQRQGSSTVTINGTPAYVITWCNDAIIAVLPRSVSAGPVVVKVDGRASNAVTAQVYTIRRW